MAIHIPWHNQFQFIATLLGRRDATSTTSESVDSYADLVAWIRAGLSYHALESVSSYLDLSIEETADWLHLAKRTLARRKKTHMTLDAVESERVLRLAQLVARAEEVLGSHEHAKRWLKKPNRALGHVVPLSLLDTDIGTQAVLAVLTRLEQGIVS